MTFTDAASIIVDGSFGVRVEDVIEVTATGGKVL
jgi:Xaa-Pro aminopeptidase